MWTLIGVIVGVLLKWGVDALATRSARRREDSLRFAMQKREAYVSFLEACENLSDAFEEIDDLGSRRNAVEDTGDDDDRAEYNKTAEVLEERKDRCYAAVNTAVAQIDMVASSSVIPEAHALAAVSHWPHSNKERERRFNAFMSKARGDLDTGNVTFSVWDWEYKDRPDPSN